MTNNLWLDGTAGSRPAEVFEIFFNIEAYGTVGDGVTNDTTAINSTLTAAGTAGGGTVWGPEGTYLANGIVIPGDNITIKGSGAGTIFKQVSGVADNTYLVSAFGTGTTTAGNKRNINICDLTLLGRSDTDAATQYVHLLEFSGVSDVTVERVVFKAFRGDAINLASNLNGGTQVERHNENITVRACKFDGVNPINRNAITITDGTDVLIENNSFVNCTATNRPGAIDIEPNANAYAIIRYITINFNKFNSISGNAGVVGLFLNQAQSFYTIPSTVINITNNYYRNCTNTAGAIFLNQIQTPTITTPRNEITVTGNTVADQTGTACEAWGIHGLTIDRNNLGNSELGVSIGYGTKCMDVTVGRNDFVKTASVGGTCIDIFTVDRLMIERNVFENIGDQAGTGRLTSFGAGSGGASTSTNVEFLNNRVTGTQATTISSKAAGHTLSVGTNRYAGNDTLTLIPNPLHWLGSRAEWNVLSKNASQSVTNSATLVSDDTMQFPMLASTKYRIRGRLFFDTTANGDFKYTFIGPASPTLVRSNLLATAAGAVPVEVAIATAYPSSSGVALVGTGTTGGFIEFDFIVHNGANASVFAFQFAQNTATAAESATVLAGSYLEFAIV